MEFKDPQGETFKHINVGINKSLQNWNEDGT